MNSLLRSAQFSSLSFSILIRRLRRILDYKELLRILSLYKYYIIRPPTYPKEILLDNREDIRMYKGFKAAGFPSLLSKPKLGKELSGFGLPRTIQIASRHLGFSRSLLPPETKRTPSLPNYLFHLS